MIFTGVNNIALSQVSDFGFLFRGIVLDTYSAATIKFTCMDATQHKMIFSGGKVLGNDGVSHICSYNTGESFSVSGFKTNGAPNDKWVWCVDGIYYDYAAASASNISGLSIAVTQGSLACDMVLGANPFGYSLSISNFAAGSNPTAQISSEVPCMTYGGTLEFYNSYQNLLTGTIGPLFSATGNPASIFLYDVDTNQSNAPISFKATFDTTFDSDPQVVTVSRTGLQAGYSLNFLPISIDGGISGLFDGVVTDGLFTFSDAPQSNLISMSVRKMNNMGGQSPTYVTINASGVTPNGMTPTYYVTGIAITSKGEYLNPPTLISTGYYQVTGLEQALSSMLFSSGCSGNLDVTFSTVERIAPASGYLKTRSVLLQNLYVQGTATYYVPESYITYSSGDGYTSAPTAIVNTGKYSNCFDVPNYYGHNTAWFTPFSSKAALQMTAGGLTGEVICSTGIVGAGQDGYLVSGVTITNIGQGFNKTTYIPKISFLRQDGDSLIKNATGNILVATGFDYSFSDTWDFSLSVGNGEFQHIPYAAPKFFTGITLTANQNYFTIKSSYSGAPNTDPILASITIGTEDGSGYIFPITGTKYFNSDPLFLKKNFNVNEDYTSTIPSSEPLSFAFTQDQLDAVYSSTAYTQNTWGIELGDLDF